MSISRVSSSADPYAAPPVTRSGEHTARQRPHEEPGARHGHHEPGGPPAETPRDGIEPAAGSTSVGTMLDVRA